VSCSGHADQLVPSTTRQGTKSSIVRLNIDMDYKGIYKRIIVRAKARSTVEGYSERHHIIPRCLGGSDDESNIAVLTAEEHYVCHQLLVKMHPDNRKLICAAQYMTVGGKRSNKFYGWLKRKFIASQTKHPIIILNCDHCQKEFKKSYARLNPRFCSQQCYLSFQRKKVLRCHGCGIDFLPKHQPNVKYCTSECYHTHRTSSLAVIATPCLHCSADIIMSATKYNRRVREGKVPKYCNQQCRKAYFVPSTTSV